MARLLVNSLWALTFCAVVAISLITLSHYYGAPEAAESPASSVSEYPMVW
jgi:hypothetical protein